MVFSEARGEARREERQRVTLPAEDSAQPEGEAALAKCRTNDKLLLCDRNKGVKKKEEKKALEQ